MKKPERRQLSHDALLAAAQKLFVSQGFRQTTVDQIAKSAKLTKGAVYFHFESKTEILSTLLARAEQIVLHPIIELNRTTEHGPKEKLVAVINKQAQLGVTHPNEVLLLILTSLALKQRSGVIARKVDEIYDCMHGEIEKIISSGQQSGIFRKDVTTREVSAIFVASHDGTFLEWHRRRAKLDGKQLARALREIILSGVLVQ